MSRVRLDDDVLNAARSALADLRDNADTRRIDRLVARDIAEPDVTLTAYWVGDLARVDVKAARGPKAS